MPQSNQTVEQVQTEEVENPQLPEVLTTHPSSRLMSTRENEGMFFGNQLVSNTEIVPATLEIIFPMRVFPGNSKQIQKKLTSVRGITDCPYEKKIE